LKITELFDMDLFRQMQEEGMISVRKHEGHPLLIANYTDQAQYKNYWNDVTLNCRGLIYQQLTGEIYARPWKKFFNLGDSKAPWINFDDRVEVTDKMDGSLGILYVQDDKLSISTRGSFHSTQAGWATKHIRKVEGLKFDSCYDFTYLFEIIYPTNRIVVDYGGFEGLVLLGCVSIKTGHVYGPNEAAAMLRWPGLTTDVMPLRSINDVLAADDRGNTEGYVIRQGDHMVKWKRPDYVELHRLISNLSEKSVWSGLEGGKTVEELIEGLPDEFHGFVKDTSKILLTAFFMREDEIIDKFWGYWNGMSETGPRKEFAMAVRYDKDKAYMFALLDKKDIAPMIWQELKPSGDSVPNDPR
jgi:RNA ligase